MGDWAYGEVVAKEAQDVMGWVSHPGTAGSFVLVVDCFTLPVGAPNAYTAMVFMNYLNDPEIAAQNAEWVGYGTPNAAAKDFIDPAILEDEGIYPPEEVSARLQWIEDVGDALELYDRIWTEFKAAVGTQ